MDIRLACVATGLYAARGIALFLGLFTFMNLMGETFIHGFDATIWWIDLRSVPHIPARIFQSLFALLMIAYGGFGRRLWKNSLRNILPLMTCAVLLTAIAIGSVNAFTYDLLVERGLLHTDAPLSFSLIVVAALALVLVSIFIPSRFATTAGSVWKEITTSGLFTLCCGLVFPLGLALCFGTTDYRRDCDATVVFGARTFAGGAPSIPLADRVRRSCELYRAGLTDMLIFSGGPGDGAVHETEAMQHLAVGLGVDPEDIILDRDGYGTRETVHHMLSIARTHGIRRLSAVSHSYHLPRIKMAFSREGLNVFTVPAEDRSGHGQSASQLGREVIAFWAYYILPLIESTGIPTGQHS